MDETREPGAECGEECDECGGITLLEGQAALDAYYLLMAKRAMPSIDDIKAIITNDEDRNRIAVFWAAVEVLARNGCDPEAPSNVVEACHELIGNFLGGLYTLGYQAGFEIGQMGTFFPLKGRLNQGMP